METESKMKDMDINRIDMKRSDIGRLKDKEKRARKAFLLDHPEPWLKCQLCKSNEDLIECTGCHKTICINCAKACDMCDTYYCTECNNHYDGRGLCEYQGILDLCRGCYNETDHTTKAIEREMNNV